jgi:hypothetical protein
MVTRGRKLIRATYWACAIFELLAVGPMLSPALFGQLMGIPDFDPGSDYRYAMGIAAVFTLGWIALLLWADRRPIERRSVLLLTIPVFVGNMVAGIYAGGSGFIQATTMLPSLIAQAILVALLGVSYALAGRPAQPEPVRGEGGQAVPRGERRSLGLPSSPDHDRDPVG